MSRIEAAQRVYIDQLETLVDLQEQMIANLKAQVAVLEARRSFFGWLFNRKTDR